MTMPTMKSALQKVLRDMTQPFTMQYDAGLDGWLVEQDGQCWLICKDAESWNRGGYRVQTA